MTLFVSRYGVAILHSLFLPRISVPFPVPSPLALNFSAFSSFPTARHFLTTFRRFVDELHEQWITALVEDRSPYGWAHFSHRVGIYNSFIVNPIWLLAAVC